MGSWKQEPAMYQRQIPERCCMFRIQNFPQKKYVSTTVIRNSASGFIRKRYMAER